MPIHNETVVPNGGIKKEAKMAQNNSQNFNRAEKKVEKMGKSEKVFNAIQKDKRRAQQSQKKTA